MTGAGGASDPPADLAADRFRDAARRYREGDPDAALRQCDGLLSGELPAPARAAAHNLRAVIFADRRKMFSAARSIDAALEAVPDNALVLDHAARIYRSLGRFDIAVARARQACACTPGSFARRYRLALLLRLAGGLDEADALAQACAQARPGLSDPWVLRAGIAADRGDRDAQVAFLRQAVAGRQPALEAWAMLAEADPTLAADLPVESSLRQAVTASGDDESRATALFALGELEWRRGNSATAFGLWRRGNDYRAAAAPFDIGDWERRMAAIAAADWAGGAVDSKDGRGLVFLVGMPRSGTTLCEQVLSAHPQVFGAGELTAMEYVAAELGWPRRMTGEPPGGTAMTVAQARRSYLECLPEACRGSRLVIDKAPRNFERLDLVFELFAEARVVWMLRHPLDTVLSCYRQDFGVRQGFTNRLDHAARVCAGHARLLRAALRRHAGRIAVVEYANLVADLDQTAHGLAAFLGVGFDPAMLHPERNPRRARTASSDQVREAVHTRSLDRWKHFSGELSGVRAYLEAEGLIGPDGSDRVRAFAAG